jgi:H+-transporting ATPase
VLGLAAVLGTVGLAATFGLFYLCEEVYKLPRDMIQTLIYLKLSVAGQLTVFVARTRGPFWSIRPAPILLVAVSCAQLVATLITVYGFGLMTSIGWGWAGFVWGYAFVAFLVEDASKLMAYRIFGFDGRGFLRRKNV